MFENRIREIGEAWNRWRVKRKRQKLLAAYAKVGRVQHDLGPGFTPTMFAYDRVLDDGLAVIAERDGEKELIWLWPEHESLERDALLEN